MSEARIRELEARIRELEAQNSELQKLVVVDSLTGLQNRTGFLVSLENEIARTRRDATYITVLMLDGNGIKRINDTYGHDAGDETIRHIAGALRRCLRSVDTAARFGGDEFAVVLHRADSRWAGLVAARILEYLRAHPLCYRDMSFTVTAGIGGVATSNSNIDGTALIRHADHLLVSQAKPGHSEHGHWVVEEIS